MQGLAGPATLRPAGVRVSSAHAADSAAGNCLGFQEVLDGEEDQDAPVDVANLPSNAISWGHVIGTSREDGTNTSLSASSACESSSIDTASKQTRHPSRHPNPTEIGVQRVNSPNICSSGSSSLSIQGTCTYQKITRRHILFAGSGTASSNSPQSNSCSETRSLSGSSACPSKSEELGSIPRSSRDRSRDNLHVSSGASGTQSNIGGNPSVIGMPSTQTQYALSPKKALDNHASDAEHRHGWMNDQAVHQRVRESGEVDLGGSWKQPLGQNELPSELAIEHHDAQTKAYDAEQIASGSTQGDIDELLERVPLDERGLPTSIGSIGHSENSCNPPCYYAQGRRGCDNGVQCGFCHLPHPGMRRGRPRPCKSKRDSYRAHWEFFRQQIEDNPDEFDIEAVVFPPDIRMQDRLKVKLKNRMKKHQELLRSQKMELQEDEAPLAEAPRRAQIVFL